jgi:hypothetical protein
VSPRVLVIALLLASGCIPDLSGFHVVGGDLGTDGDASTGSTDLASGSDPFELLSSPVTTKLNAVFGSGIDVYAAGIDLLHRDPSGSWSEINGPINAGAEYTALGRSATQNLVGENESTGAFVFGLAGTNVKVPSITGLPTGWTIGGIHSRGDTLVVGGATGTSGFFIRECTTWQSVALPLGQTAVTSTPTAFFSVGRNRSVYRIDASCSASYTAEAPPAGTELLRGVWGTASGELYAVGDGGLVLHRSIAGDWNMETVPSSDNLRAISGRGEDVYIAGDGGTVLWRLAGGPWQSFEAPAPDGGIKPDLLGVWADPAGTSVYVVGTEGVILIKR